jgi:hypothetical protein
MKLLSTTLALFLAATAWSASAQVSPVPSADDLVSTPANLALKADLDARFSDLQTLYESWQSAVESFNRDYGNQTLDKTSAEAKAGMAAQARAQDLGQRYESALAAYQRDLARLAIRPSAPTSVPNFATDASAARLSGIQLQLVDRRISGLQKAIVLLGDDNPEWARERERVLEDTHEDAVGISWEGVNLMSIGLAELAKSATQSRVTGARVEALFMAIKEPLATLPAEEVRLNQIMATTNDPALAKAILEYEAALHRLHDAQYSADVASMFSRARDAAETLRSEFEIMRSDRTTSDAAADGLYQSSALLGSVAIIFVAEGPEAIGAAAASAGSSALVGGREVVNLWQERGRLKALEQNASDRNRMKVELAERLTGLQQQRERLLWAVKHANAGEDVRQ